MGVELSNMTVNGKAPKNKVTEVQDRKWWEASDKTIAQAVTNVFKQIYENDSVRRTQYNVSTRLYANINIVGASGTPAAKAASQNKTINDRLTYNIVQSVIDTLDSKMMKNKPKPMFLTEGGDWDLQQKAKKREKFIDGIFYQNKMNILAPQCRRDAFIKGDGLLYQFIRDGKIVYERVPVEELYVDQAEAEFASPQQLHRIKNIDREVLIGLFPEKEKVIRECNKATVDIVGASANVSDLITVTESWKLPSRKGAKDGKHTIVINSGELVSEPYTKMRFNFSRIGWSRRLTGFWSQSLAEQLQNIQLEINKTLWVIQRSLHMAGSFKVLIENGSKIVTEHLTNDIGAIINYNDTPPQYIIPPPIQQEYFQHLMNLKQLGFEQAGVSMMSATAQKPAGLDSGKALRTFNDIESERFLKAGRDYEDFHLDVAEVTMDLAKDLYEQLEQEGKGKDAKVTYIGKNAVEVITWEEIAPEEGEEFVIKMYPVSQLPSDPVGRLEAVQDYAEAGYLKPRTARRLLDFPDLDQVEALENAEEDYLNKILEKICDVDADDADAVSEAYTPPDQYDDPQLAKELCLQYIAKGKLHNLNPKNMELLFRFNDQIDLLVEKAMPQDPVTGNAVVPGASPAGGPADPTGAPTANPEATPQNNLIPNGAS